MLDYAWLVTEAPEHLLRLVEASECMRKQARHRNLRARLSSLLQAAGLPAVRMLRIPLPSGVSGSARRMLLLALRRAVVNARGRGVWAWMQSRLTLAVEPRPSMAKQAWNMVAVAK
eukprot:11283997-Alexandrium_andersonii.AAC.1